MFGISSFSFLASITMAELFHLSTKTLSRGLILSIFLLLYLFPFPLSLGLSFLFIFVCSHPSCYVPVSSFLFSVFFFLFLGGGSFQFPDVFFLCILLFFLSPRSVFLFLSPSSPLYPALPPLDPHVLFHHAKCFLWTQ